MELQSEPLFDLTQEYDAMLDRGLRLSGENREFFMRGRVADLAAELSSRPEPGRILDLGCGLGHTAAYLASVFRGADVLGVDTAAEALAYAESHYGGERVRFLHLDEFLPAGDFDLCYVNGVFHHIPPAAREEAVRKVLASLSPGGLFAFFENNPWNPGTRLVMSRIPFDREARTLSPPAARALLSSSGFRSIGRTRYLFFFPGPLRWLRFIEPHLRRAPLGAQYWLLGRKIAELDGADGLEARASGRDGVVSQPGST
jgi:SAM-dependent methyltransferase